MNRFILQIVAMNEIAEANFAQDVKTNRAAAGQKLVMEETRKLISKYLEVERIALEYGHTYVDEVLHARFTELLKELLNGVYSLDALHLHSIQWITPILLGGISCKNEEILGLTQKLVRRVSSTPESVPKETVSADVEKEGLLSIPQLADERPDALSDPPGDEAEVEKQKDDVPQSPEEDEIPVNQEDEMVQVHDELEAPTCLEKVESSEQLEECSDDALISETMRTEERSGFEQEDDAEPNAEADMLCEAAKDTVSGSHSDSRTGSVGSFIKEAEV